MGFPGPWCNHPIANLRVHPGQLHSWLTGEEQTVGVDVDVVARTTHVPVDDVAQARVKMLTYEGVIACVFDQCPYGFEKPQGGVCGVVLGCFAGIGKAIRQHALIDVVGKLTSMLFATSYRPEVNVRPGRAIIVSRPQSANQ